MSQPIPLAYDKRVLDTDVSITRLLAGAQAALEREPERARHYLQTLAALFEGTPEPIDALDTDAMPPALPPANGLTPWQVRLVVDYIEANLEHPLPVERLAALVNLSRNHFSRAFKIAMGVPPHAFVIKRRLHRAQTLMLQTSDPLCEIACACGLADQAHLSRLFRQVIGETPLRWRRRWRQTGAACPPPAPHAPTPHAPIPRAAVA